MKHNGHQKAGGKDSRITPMPADLRLQFDKADCVRQVDPARPIDWGHAVVTVRTPTAE